MEIPASPSLRSTPPPYTPPSETGSRTPPCGTPRAPQLSADYTDMMVSALESGELRYEELSQRKVPDNNNGHVDYYSKPNGEFDNRVSDMSHPSVQNSVNSYSYNTEPNQQTSSSVTILDSGYNTAPEDTRFIPETQLNSDISNAIPSSSTIPETQHVIPETQSSISETLNSIPETQSVSETQSITPESRSIVPETQNVVPETQNIDQDLGTSLDESKENESTLSESQLTGSVDVVPEIPGEGEVLYQAEESDGIFSYNPQSTGHGSGTGDRSARISQDSGFCEASSTFEEISQDCSDVPSHEPTS